MPAGTAYLQGGPCDGRTKKITEPEAEAGTIACGGHEYLNANGELRPNGDIIFKDHGPIASNGGPSPTINAPHALGGWKALRKSINRGMPSALTYSQHGTSEALRTLRRARKVRL